MAAYAANYPLGYDVIIEPPTRISDIEPPTRISDILFNDCMGATFRRTVVV